MNSEKINASSSLFTSRFFTTTDPFIDSYELIIRNFWRRKEVYSWDFRQLLWWSRVYEYAWLQRIMWALRLDSTKSTLKVMDAGCGKIQAGAFILADVPNVEVTAIDLLERHTLIERSKRKNLRYRKHDLRSIFFEQMDVIACISTLEHLSHEDQQTALRAFHDTLYPGGWIILTLDWPGYEFDVNPQTYLASLESWGYQFKIEQTDPRSQLWSNNGIIQHPGFPEVNREKISTYRITARKPI